MKYKTKALLGCFLILWGASQARSQFDSGSDGTFGAIDFQLGDPAIVLPPDGIVNATTINVAEGASMGFVKNEFNTPVFLLATGDVTIAGTINVNGGGGNASVGGSGGPGGFDGGTPGSAGVSPGDGHGPGGGGAGNPGTSSDDAGSGSYAGQSNNGFSAQEGATYGSPLLIPMIGGSGGGGITGTPGSGGGGGGGAVLIASNTQIEITGSGIIDANGGNQISGTHNGGSGGAVRLVAPKVFGSGAINCQSRRSDGLRSGSTYAGQGRIRIDSIDRSGLGISYSPAGFTSVGSNMVVFPTPVPRLDITQVAGTDVALGTASGVSILLPFNDSPDKTVTVRAEDFNKVVNFVVALQPVNGSRILVPASVDNAAANPASETVNITLPINTQTEIFVWTVPDP